jgi:hypothetical protein
MWDARGEVEWIEGFDGKPRGIETTMEDQNLGKR